MSLYVALLERVRVHIFGQEKVETYFCCAPLKSNLVCSPEMVDMAGKQPISEFKVAESMFFELQHFSPAAAGKKKKQFRQAEAPHTQKL